MSKGPTISSLVSGYTSASHLNTTLQDIVEAFENTVSRDGSTPNEMSADLDMDGNDILNVGDVNASRLYVGGVRVLSTTSTPSWEGGWTTATDYVVDDIVRQDGNVYICLVAHTSGTFSTDLTNLKWELFASKGSAGAGTGDMLAANNLSDVANASTARSNLGLGTVAVESVLPVSKGGTGSTTAADARTALGLGTAAVVDVIDEDSFVTDSATRPPSQQSVKAYHAANPIDEPLYTSETTSWFNTRVTVSHGLGRYPRLVNFFLECTTANNNYAIGDRILLSPSSWQDSWTGVHAYVTTSDISAYIYTITIRNKTTNMGAQLSSSSNWKLVVEAY